MEVWKPVPDYEGLYEVSDLGRVRSFYYNKCLRPRLVRGYLTVALYKQGVPKNAYIHRLVASAFIPNSDTTKEINHIDGDKTNNTITNLEWVTKSENEIHAYSLGIKPILSGENHPNHKLSRQDVFDIKNSYIPRHKFLGCTALGKKYGVSHQCISDIVNNKRWNTEELSC